MPTVRIPRTSGRQKRGWALLIRRVSPCGGIRILEGTHLRPGSAVSEADLRPTPEYPVTPLLIEYAGTTGRDSEGRKAHGHNRALDVHILWRYDRPAGWTEIARVASEGPGWREYFLPIVTREFEKWRSDDPVDHVAEARAASSRICAAIDIELARLEAEDRRRVVSFLYDQIVARFTDEMEETAAESLPERKPAGRELRPVTEREGTGNE